MQEARNDMIWAILETKELLFFLSVSHFFFSFFYFFTRAMPNCIPNEKNIIQLKDSEVIVKWSRKSWTKKTYHFDRVILEMIV